MWRRRAVSKAIVAAIPFLAGCSRGIGGQPDSVPVEVTNESDASREYDLTITAAGVDDDLLSMGGSLSPGARSTGEFEVADPNATYAVRVAMAGEEWSEEIDGSGLRSVTVGIEAATVTIATSKT
ncbi:hypothetical protein Hbl1158_01810 [Halobaculum sp. CBA1158]|uniref:hypothetical protein n=1 Tax=Halobaculum sp. CBA1158 TaxID=2904243 RepID=UPI001F350C55|nr:hypothetical protein [Halobaculum sp. CBA1158]UIP00133.1 hypothetical protein Hbl1158_01810 [Halobaculum sp. CBA1158]